MAKTLDVYLHDQLIGQLIQDGGGQTVFEYATAWLDRPGATPLSVSLPLRRVSTTLRQVLTEFSELFM
jgi:serine/threonine-protein kinase HipA